MANKQARDARDAGIATAVEHASAVMPGWPQLAFEALCEYAKQHPTFTIEQARKAMNVPEPPNTKAWGGVVSKAMRAGIVEADGWTQAEDPKVHCNQVTLWRSLVCEESAKHSHESAPNPLRDAAIAAEALLSDAYSRRLLEGDDVRQVVLQLRGAIEGGSA